ncbi:MAG: acyl-CoA thioesterase [Desulfarculales bacterium]|jgi:uncharacterized protein (TIGR00369 family)|nr:acyl-CoA thioesterase [Desulfarculales bacterium]
MNKTKKIQDSRITMNYLTLPHDANHAGNVHGGVIVKLMDTAGRMVAARHCRLRCVAAAMDRINFHNPVYAGELLNVRASVNYVSRRSMEIGARVESENLLSGEIRHIASSYLLFVPAEVKNKLGRIPRLILSSHEDQRRNREAAMRRQARRLALAAGREKRKTNEILRRMEPKHNNQYEKIKLL